MRGAQAQSWPRGERGQAFLALWRKLRINMVNTRRGTKGPEVDVSAAMEAEAEVVPAAVTPDARRELSEYELQRLENIRRNEEYMESLGLGSTKVALAAKPRQASQRGVSKRKRALATSELRRSSRLKKEDLTLVSLPSDFKEPRNSYVVEEKATGQRVDLLLKDEEATEADEIAAVLRHDGESPHISSAKSYEASLRSLRLAERDVVKVTRGGKGCALAFHPMASRLMLASGDSLGRVGVWDVENDDDERCAHEFVDHHDRSIAALAWQNDVLLSAGYDSLVRALDFAKGKSVVRADYAELHAVGDLINAAFDGNLIYATHGDGSASLLDSRRSNNHLVWNFQAHDNKATHVALRPGRPEIATSGNDTAVRIWDLRAAKRTPLWESTHSRAVRGCDWTKDGRALCSVSYDQSLRIYHQDALLSSNGAKANCVKIDHDNRTGRYLTPFKPLFDPHAPEPVVVLGSMQQPRRIDLIRAPPSARRGIDAANNKLATCLVHQLHDNGDVFRAVTSIHDVHPTHHVIAGINNSSRISVWRAQHGGA